MDEDKKILIDLEQLSALQMDSINGFEQLSGQVENPAVKYFLVNSHKQSVGFWNDLNKEIEIYHGEIKDKGTIKGAINHLWMKLKKDILHSDLDSVLENIKLCDEFNVKCYEAILDGELPSAINIMLANQLDSLKKRIDEITSLQKDISKDIR